MKSRFELPVPRELPDGTKVIHLTEAAAIVDEEFKSAGWRFHLGTVPVGDWPNSLELKSVKAWLASLGRPEEELEVLYIIAVSLRNEWAWTVKRTAKQHKKLCERITKLSADLADALRDADGVLNPGIALGVRTTEVWQFLSQEEIEQMFNLNRLDDKDGNFSRPFITSTVEDVLARLANFAERVKRLEPLHTQPTKHGAERGYFIRRMNEVMRRRYGEVPHHVLASVATVALDEDTSRELVSKLLA